MLSQSFRNLHQGPEVLLLPNAWDAVTARLIESLGAKAIATTSAGFAWSNGYPDGSLLPEETLIAAIREIARVIRVPLSVDIEAGYSDRPRAVARLVERILAVGVVGINIEDGVGSADLLVRKFLPSGIARCILVSKCLSTRARMFTFEVLFQGRRPLRRSSAGPRATAKQAVTVCLFPASARDGDDFRGHRANTAQCHGGAEYAVAEYAATERRAAFERGRRDSAGRARADEFACIGLPRGNNEGAIR